jgi:uncharacterized protein DUF3309
VLAIESHGPDRVFNFVQTVLSLRLHSQLCRALLRGQFHRQRLPRVKVHDGNARPYAANGDKIMSLGLILVIILIIFLLGGFSGRFGGYGYGYGHGGVGLIGIILIIIVVLLLTGRL